MIKKIFLSFVGVCFLGGCSSIRMRYDAEMKAGDGRKANYSFERSYDVGAFPALCGLTAIFLGGACWYYLVMPTVNQEESIERDGKKYLLEDETQAKGFLIRESKVSQRGWGEKEDESKFEIRKK